MLKTYFDNEKLLPFSTSFFGLENHEASTLPYSPSS